MVKPFLANLHYTISKKYSYMYYSMTPKIFYFFFNIWVSTKRKIVRWFQIRGNNLKKVYLEKVISQKLLHVSSREEYKLEFCTLLLPVTFLLANFLHFSQQFWNQCKIPIFKFCEEKVFRSYKHFFETLKPCSQETAQNFEKRVLQKCLGIAFFTYILVNLHHFLKKHHNHCTLAYSFEGKRLKDWLFGGRSGGRGGEGREMCILVQLTNCKPRARIFYLWWSPGIDSK